MKIKKIVITGGPCAGKTTAIGVVRSFLEAQGYRVLTIAETATELISGGITFHTCQRNIDFQGSIFNLQLEKEQIFENAAQSMQDDPIVILCDRGAMDSKAYLQAAEYEILLKRRGLTEEDILARYAAVFFLVTAAKGAEAFYTTQNNQARSETPLEAADTDDRLIAVWQKHPHFDVIDSSADFDVKIKTLIEKIDKFLKNPEYATIG